MAQPGNEGDEWVQTTDKWQWIHDGNAWHWRPFEDRLLSHKIERFTKSKRYDIGTSVNTWINLEETLHTVKKYGGANTQLLVQGQFSCSSKADLSKRWNSGWWVGVWCTGMNYLGDPQANPKPWNDFAGRGIINEQRTDHPAGLHNIYYSTLIPNLVTGDKDLRLAVSFRGEPPGSYFDITPQNEWTMTVWEVMQS